MPTVQTPAENKLINRKVKPADETNSGLGSRIRAYAESIWSLDVRSLAVFRIGLALVILVDLIIRSSDLEAFYTDFGLLARAPYLQNFSDPWFVSVHMISGTFLVQALLFVLAGVFAVFMLLGYRTRVFTVLSWFLLISLHSRNRMIMQGGDDLLRMFMFWAMFLPLGAVYSVDSALDSNPQKRSSPSVFSAGSVALLAQVVLLYWCAVAYKTGAEWRIEGSAMYYALSIEQMSTPIGRFLLHLPPVILRFMTFFVLAYESLVPLLLLLTTGPFRAAAVLLIILLHLGMGTCIKLGPFPWVAAAGISAFLPTWFWKQMSPESAKPKRLEIYYDGTCDFCKKTVAILRTFLALSPTQVMAAQEAEDPRLGQEMDQQHSWIVVDEEGKHWYKFEALTVVVAYSPLFRGLERIMRWGPVRSLGLKSYEWVAGHRPQLSSGISFLRYRPNFTANTLGMNLVCAGLLLYVFLWNMGDFSSVVRLPEKMRFVAFLLRIDQAWDMFSPYPLKDDGWYVIPGKLKDGREVNLFPFAKGKPISWTKPDVIGEMYPNERWRKYLMNLYFTENQRYRLYFGQYLCRDWNRDKTPNDDNALMTFDIYFMKKTTQPNFTAVMIKDLLWHHQCYDLPPPSPTPPTQPHTVPGK